VLSKSCRSRLTHLRDLRAADDLLNAAAREISGEDSVNGFRLAFHRARMAYLRREYDPNNPNLAVALRTADPELQLHSLNFRELGGCLTLYHRYGDACRLQSVAMPKRCSTSSNENRR
jgi:hypothetical protein